MCKMFKVLLLFVFFVAISTSNASDESETHPVIDAIIHGLKKEKWDDGEAPCLEKTLELLHNVKNFTFWATWIWDANKLPSGNLYGSWVQLSNFDQCMNLPWLETHPQFKTQYCTAEVKMVNAELKRRVLGPYESTETYIKTKTKFRQRVNQFTWGVCLLASCQPRSVVKIMRNMYLGTHFRAVPDPTITISHCQVAGVTEEYTNTYFGFMFFLAMLFIISLVATCYRTHTKHSTITSGTTVAVLLESFCMKTNSAELTKSHKDEIKVINGIRFLTSAGVVWLHVLYLTMVSGCMNSMNFDNKVFLFDKAVNMNVLVDTFFALSGLLHIKGLLAKKQTNFFIILWKRYVRLFGLFALSMFYYASVVRFHGSGPLWDSFYNFESGICHKYWWYSLLMLNTSNYSHCNSVTWYIACDFQYTIFGTTLVFMYQKSKRLAITVFGIAAVIFVAIPAILTYVHKLPAMFFIIIEDFLKLRSYELADVVYFNSFSRAGPYVVGMSMGYILHVYKPANYRQSLSKLYSIVGTMLSLLLMTTMVCLGAFFLERDYDALEASVAAALFRTLWSFGVCCILGICEYGNLPFVTEFLSQPFFTPLSRLSYGLYMFHCLILQQTNKVVTVKSAPVFDSFGVVVDALGVGTVCLGLSYVLWLILEAPLNRLSDHFVCKRFQSKVVEQSTHNENSELEKEKTKAS